MLVQLKLHLITFPSVGLAHQGNAVCKLFLLEYTSTGPKPALCVLNSCTT